MQDMTAPPPATNRLLTAAELAERWQCNVHAVYRLARTGRLPVVRVGRWFRFHPAAVEEWERSGGVPLDVA